VVAATKVLSAVPAGLQGDLCHGVGQRLESAVSYELRARSVMDVSPAARSSRMQARTRRSTPPGEPIFTS
jgi:hypothetical protein